MRQGLEMRDLLVDILSAGTAGSAVRDIANSGGDERLVEGLEPLPGTVYLGFGGESMTRCREGSSTLRKNRLVTPGAVTQRDVGH